MELLAGRFCKVVLCGARLQAWHAHTLSSEHNLRVATGCWVACWASMIAQRCQSCYRIVGGDNAITR